MEDRDRLRKAAQALAKRLGPGYGVGVFPATGVLVVYAGTAMDRARLVGLVAELGGRFDGYRVEVETLRAGVRP